MRCTLHGLGNLPNNSLTVNPYSSHKPPRDRALHKKFGLFPFFHRSRDSVA